MDWPQLGEAPRRGGISTGSPLPLSPPAAQRGGLCLTWKTPSAGPPSGGMLPARSGPELTTPSPAAPSPDRLDPPGSQVLTLHPEGPTDRAARAAGARPGAGLGLLCPKRPFRLHPDTEEGLLGGGLGPAAPPSPACLRWLHWPSLGEGPAGAVSAHCTHPCLPSPSSCPLPGFTPPSLASHPPPRARTPRPLASHPLPWLHTPLPGLTPHSSGSKPPSLASQPLPGLTPPFPGFTALPWPHTPLPGLTPHSLASHPPSLASQPFPGLTPPSLGSHPPPWAHTSPPWLHSPSLGSHPTPLPGFTQPPPWAHSPLPWLHSPSLASHPTPWPHTQCRQPGTGRVSTSPAPEK